MPVNGKAKGNKFERDIANLLSSRFQKATGLEKSFRRNADSGSFWGATNQKRIETHDTDYAVYGDIVCPRNFNFALECKNYKAPPTFNSWLNQSINEWDKWIKQASQDATNSRKDMLLVIKYNRTTTFVIVDKKQDNVPLAGIYKEYFVYTLEDFLEQDDTVFFTKAD